MRKFIILAALAFTTPAMADCRTLGEAAELVMTARQANVPMSDLMDIANGLEPDAAVLFRAIVQDAYAQSAWSSPSVQASAIADFRNDVERLCYEAF